MSIHESPAESSRLPASRPWRGGWPAVDGAALATSLWSWARRLHPLALYRLLALGIASLIVVADLHALSSVTSDGRWILLAAGHVGMTAVVAPRLAKQSDTVNNAAIVVDGLFCVLLLALAHGWRGPFWLYSMSAVFWPSFRYSLRGALASVALFDALVLLTNVDHMQEIARDGFGGDLVTRMLMVFILAGAISLTAQSLSKMRLLATEAERNRIARDLHDGIGKTMGGISMEARSLSAWIERDPSEAQRRARYVARVSERAANEVREVIRGLRQSEATTHLFPTIQSIVEEWARVHQATSVHLRLNGADAPIPVLIHGEVARMLNEFLANVERHAQASEARVRVTLSSAGVTLAVRDNGVGFNAASQDPWSEDGHFGLLGARERASMLGGHFQLLSAPGGGTEITVDLPLVRNEC